MIIRRLSIGDFGIFRDQVMDDIAPRIVLIAGPNRAGKTTLMQALRYLGYKFPRSNILPPPTTEYKLEADLQVSDFGRYIISRSGYSDPQLSGNNGLQLKDIYHIDDFTYRQLFTISLDELRRIPEGVDTKQTRELQSVLLGAGMVDLMMIPNVKSEFEKTANNIGGVNGNYSVKQFKSDNEIIVRAMKQRRGAHQEIEEYRQKQQELEETQDTISGKTNRLTEEKKRLDQLRFLAEQYEEFQKYKNLSREIEKPENQSILESDAVENLERAKNIFQSYEQIVDQYEDQLRQFQQMIPRDDWIGMKNNLLEQESVIIDWTQRRSGLEERVKNYINSANDNEHKIKELQERLQQINEEYGSDLSVLKEIRTDRIEKSQLRDVVTEHQKLEDRLERKNEELEKSERELKTLQEEFESLEKPADGMTRQTMVRGSGIFLVAGVLLVLFLNVAIGLIVGLGGIALVLGTAYISNMRSIEPKRRYFDKEEALKHQLRETESIQQEVDTLQNELKVEREALDNFKHQLQLESKVSPELLKDIYRDIEALKKDLSEWEQQKNRLEAEQETLREDVGNLTSVVKSIIEISDESKSLGEQIQFLVGRLGEISSWLQTAKSLQASITEKAELEEEIDNLIPEDEKNPVRLEESNDYINNLNNYINKGEAQKELLDKVADQQRFADILTGTFSGMTAEAFLGHSDKKFENEQILELLEEHFDQFVSEETLKDELRHQDKAVQNLESEIEELKQQSTKLETSLENLATSDKLDEAQQQIDEARSRLEPLAREYAISRIADIMLGKLRDKLLQRTKDELLSDASDIFKTLTSETYKQIALPDELESADFLAISDNENASLKSEYLSRGTQEQLFLSVRMSRILDIEPPLPVILDDSLVNFDVQHRKKAAGMINTLSEHNQVFVLTCHPEIVDYVAGQNSSVQFWTIQNQQIELSDYDGVRNLLRRT